ncbi:MAG: hypothetical protein P1P59_09250 [Treponemataceae bacterium]
MYLVLNSYAGTYGYVIGLKAAKKKITMLTTKFLPLLTIGNTIDILHKCGLFNLPLLNPLMHYSVLK